MPNERTEQRRRHTPTEIRRKLNDADGALATGQSVSSICGRLGITRQTYYRWRKTLGAFDSEAGAISDTRDQASDALPPVRVAPKSIERLRLLEFENQRLRDAVVALMLEKMSLAKK